MASARPGSIILMHPMWNSRAVDRVEIPFVVEGLRAAGFELVTVSELLALR
ncbi:MAG: hypothetical protein ACU0DW_02020 [Shimia sp.]